MSRIGRLPIPLPKEVAVAIEGNEITIKGPRGELRRPLPPDMTATTQEGKLLVSRPSDSRQHRALHGLTRSLLAGMVEGVTHGFQKSLEIVGVGYRAQKDGDNLVLQLGFTHPVKVPPLPGISFVLEGTNKVTVAGINKELVGQVAANLRAIKPPDHYKGKGIRYAGEHVRLKAGKALSKKT
ncbi:MAG: large subunit ribosomal protein [Dehalococcoidia bacterium]|nr:large subunit ribosomal protein [Dehalococcoidia bacterium]